MQLTIINEFGAVIPDALTGLVCAVIAIALQQSVSFQALDIPAVQIV
ncbi:MAG: hypothetical protein N0C81_14915 [Candidatus Thiodiazotropha lotti]|uniref:Uncharacterized protein n=1 Tax=Candidatus Thiodiazotropha lotti TaxID=2792787 RepID=A0A9E4N0G5_9GAMM|nr:hypothetical protein [Candidatus Thiodiazotropha lotti]MCG7923263.1 hypothetical protein [Candidatus Thiodiazotropha lotti]MCG7931128.1 hypothetical protein [Candidatus Thiodiazotropha lotti]MCG7938765.1 hypothetical protein [Candidatus Thiodiazotropha lotti]MCG7988564.1 hypothetical protein [Candidatus Thiodiazotropha lotti]